MGGAASAVGSAIGSAGGIVGGIIGDAKASGDRAQSQGYAEQAYNSLIGIGLPPDLSKEIVLQKFQEAGILTPEVEQAILLTHSAQAQLQEAPETRDAQMEALNAFKQLGSTGLGAQDKAALNQIRDQVQTDLEGKRQQILQSMQARGMGGSGAELISQLQASQGSANQASDQGLQVAAQAQQRALEALGQSANLAGQVRGQDYTAASNRAKAEDEMNRFNVQGQQEQQTRNVAAKNAAQYQNLANKQAVQNANVDQSNQELMRQKQAEQDYWNNLVKRAQIQSGGYQGMADEYAGRADRIAGKEQKLWTGIGNMAGGSVSAFGGGSKGGGSPGEPTKENPLWFSDEKLKKNIHSGDVEVKEFLDNVKPYSYEYKDNNEHNVSPMAQDLEKSSIGSRAVKDTPKGKLVDYDKLIQSVVASQGYLNEEIKKLKRHAEPKKAAFGGMVPGEAITKDNNFRNDLVDIQAAPGEIILPREVTESQSPEDEAYEFVKKLLAKKRDGKPAEVVDPRAIDQDAVKLDKSLPGNLGKDDPAAIDPNREPAKDMGGVAPIDYSKDKASEALQLMFGKNDVSTLKALEEAQHERNMGNFASDLSRGAALVSEGISGIENKGLKEQADVYAKRAGQPIEDLKAKIEILKKDPNSSVSKGYKSLLEKKMGMKFGGDVSAADIEPFLTASMKNELDPYKQAMLDINKQRLEHDKIRLGQADKRLDLGKERETRLVDQFGHKKVSKFEDDAGKAVDSLRKTETWKSAEKTLVDVPTIKNLLDDSYKKGGQSLAMLGPRIAKAIAGEVGVLTEQDVTRYVKNPELIAGMVDTMKKLSEGKISEASYQNLKRLLDISEQEAQRKIQEATDREANLFARRQGIQLEEAKYFIDNAYQDPELIGRKTDEFEIKDYNNTSKAKEQKADGKVTVEKDGKRFKLPKSQLKQALEQGYSLVEE